MVDKINEQQINQKEIEEDDPFNFDKVDVGRNELEMIEEEPAKENNAPANDDDDIFFWAYSYQFVHIKTAHIVSNYC